VPFYQAFYREIYDPLDDSSSEIYATALPTMFRECA
jgi:hypothetical protein